MELKCWFTVTAKTNKGTYNRTIVELKYLNQSQKIFKKLPYNRTIVELKSEQANAIVANTATYNRTIVELKSYNERAYTKIT